MNKPSERIVVFVTTAQKRAITSSAEELGISVSELMRRAVLSFGATSEQVKAASIVDRLRAPRAPDALNAALQRVARGTRHAKATLPPALQTHPGEVEADAAAHEASAPPPLLPAGVLAALEAAADEEAVATADAVARIAAAEAAQRTEPTEADSLVPSRKTTRRTRIDTIADEDDPTTEGSRFA